MDILKRIGNGLLCVLLAAAALSMAGSAWYELATSGELPIYARHGSGTLEQFTPAYFVVAMFYALVVVIGVTMILVLIDQVIGIRFLEKQRSGIRRGLAVLAAVSFLVPIVISIARVSAGN